MTLDQVRSVARAIEEGTSADRHIVSAVIFELAAEVAELRSFKEAVMGWREYDWPEGFCRHTAEMIAQNANWRSNPEFKEGE